MQKRDVETGKNQENRKNWKNWKNENLIKKSIKLGKGCGLQGVVGLSEFVSADTAAVLKDVVVPHNEFHIQAGGRRSGWVANMRIARGRGPEIRSEIDSDL